METLNQLNFARVYTLGRISQSREAAWDIKPQGFNNTIRWNVGHIYVNAEIFTQKAVPTYEIVHPEWLPLFIPSTSPDSWEVEPPTKVELVQALEAQADRLKSALENKVDNLLLEPMAIGNLHQMDTVNALIQFMVWHEGVHAGIIHALNRAAME